MSAAGGAREWAAAMLRAETGVAMPRGAAEIAVAMRGAREEGVVSLLFARMCAQEVAPTVEPELRQAFATEARRLAAHTALVHIECRRITAALRAVGVEAVWLKGIALAQWLYPLPHLRDVGDADLLLASLEETRRAAAAVAPLGYHLPNPHVAGQWVVNELLAVSPRAGLELDLHWALGNGPLYAHRLQWREVREAAQPLPAFGEGALALAPTHALVHAAMHLATNQLTGGGQRLRWLYDLHLLASRLGPEEWQHVLALAGERGLADTCYEALQKTQADLRTAVPESVMAALRQAADAENFRASRLGGWAYLQWTTLRSVPRWRDRARWVREVLIPDMPHLRVRYGADGSGAMRVLMRRVLDGTRRLRRYLKA